MASTDPALVAVLAVSGFFVAWYFAGGAWNRRLARRLADEMKGVVLAFGGRSVMQWYGYTAFRMGAKDADAPFRDVSVVVTLRPREMPINWGIGLAQGRSDLAVVQASLREQPTVAFEIVDPETATGRRRARTGLPWTPVTLSGRRWLLSSEDEGKARKLLESLDGGAGLRGYVGLHVVAGTESGIGASIAIAPGEMAGRFEGVRGVARAVAQ